LAQVLHVAAELPHQLLLLLLHSRPGRDTWLTMFA
jgi:hypothetical protein